MASNRVPSTVSPRNEPQINVSTLVTELVSLIASFKAVKAGAGASADGRNEPQDVTTSAIEDPILNELSRDIDLSHLNSADNDGLSRLFAVNRVTLRFHDPRLEILFYEYLFKENKLCAMPSRKSFSRGKVCTASRLRFWIFLAFFSIAALVIISPLEPGNSSLRISWPQGAAWLACIGLLVVFRLIFWATAVCRFGSGRGGVLGRKLTVDGLGSPSSHLEQARMTARYMCAMDTGVPFVIAAMTSLIVVVEHTLTVSFMHVLTYRFGVNFGSFDQLPARFFEKLVGVVISLIIYNLSGLLQLRTAGENDIVAVEGIGAFDRSRSRLIANAVINCATIFVVAGLAYNREYAQRRMFFGSLMSAILKKELRRLKEVSSQLILAQLPTFAVGTSNLYLQEARDAAHTATSIVHHAQAASQSQAQTSGAISQQADDADGVVVAMDGSSGGVHPSTESMPLTANSDAWHALQSFCTIMFCYVTIVPDAANAGRRASLSAGDVLGILNKAFRQLDDAAASCGLDKVRTLNSLWIGAAGLRGQGLPGQDLPGEDPEFIRAGVMNCLKLASACMASTGKSSSTPYVLTFGIATEKTVAGLLAGDRLEYQLFGDAVAEAHMLSSLAVQYPSVCMSESSARYLNDSSLGAELKSLGKFRMPATCMHGASSAYFKRFALVDDADKIGALALSPVDSASNAQLTSTPANRKRRMGFRRLGASSVMSSALREPRRPTQGSAIETSASVTKVVMEPEITIPIPTTEINNVTSSRVEQLLLEHNLMDGEPEDELPASPVVKQEVQALQLGCASAPPSVTMFRVLQSIAASRGVFLAYMVCVLSTQLAADADGLGRIAYLDVSKVIIAVYGFWLIFAVARLAFGLLHRDHLWPVGVGTYDNIFVMVAWGSIMLLEAIRIGTLERMPDVTCGRFSRVTVWIMIPGVSYILTAVPMRFFWGIVSALTFSACWILASFIGFYTSMDVVIPPTCPQPYPVWPRPVILVLLVGYMASIRWSQEGLLVGMYRLQRRLTAAQQKLFAQAEHVLVGVKEVFSPHVLHMCLHSMDEARCLADVHSTVTSRLLDRPLGSLSAFDEVRVSIFDPCCHCGSNGNTIVPSIDRIMQTVDGCAILSVDIVTLRRLSGLLNAEDTMSVVAAVVEKIDTCTKSFGGQRASFLGTSYVAAFGLMETTTQDTRNNDGRPTRILSALQASAAIFAELSLISTQFGIDLQANSSIDVGTVCAGIMGSRYVSYQVIGLPVLSTETALRALPGMSECAISDNCVMLLYNNLHSELVKTMKPLAVSTASFRSFNWSAIAAVRLLGQSSRFINEEMRIALQSAQQLASVSLSADDFKILKGLGTGQFAAVYLVLHRHTRIPCAVKVIDASQTRSKSLQAELKALSAPTNHPNLVEFYCALPGPGRQIWLLQEYIEGFTAENLLEVCGRLSERRCRALAAELVAAVGHLHELGIIHRDIKPANIMLTQSGHVKLIDLGLAALVTPFAPPGHPQHLDNVMDSSSVISLLQSLTPGATGKLVMKMSAKTEVASTLSSIVGSCLLVDIGPIDPTGGPKVDGDLYVALRQANLLVNRVYDTEAASRLLRADTEGVLDAIIVHVHHIRYIDQVDRWLAQVRQFLVHNDLHVFVALECGPANYKAATVQLASHAQCTCVRFPLEPNFFSEVVNQVCAHSGLPPLDTAARLGTQHLQSSGDVYVSRDSDTDHKTHAPFGRVQVASILQPYVTSIAGTPFAMAPETARRRCGLVSDWFSVGVTLFRCLAGVLPFQGDTRRVVQRNIEKGAVQWSFLPPHCSANVRDLLARLLEVDPAKRFGANGDALEILSHPFFSSSQMNLGSQESADSLVFTPVEGKAVQQALDEASGVGPSVVAWTSTSGASFSPAEVSSNNTGEDDRLAVVASYAAQSASGSAHWRNVTNRLAAMKNSQLNSTAFLSLSSSSSDISRSSEP